jgi:Leucine-rich repeat (LRR) protein
MKRISFLLFFITSLSASAQFTSIPDVNFEKSLISIGLDTGNPDGKVLTSNIIKTTYLDVSSKLIRDLTGIQDFAELKNLYCDSNYLTSLNVSKNVSLTNLSCSFNKIRIIR